MAPRQNNATMIDFSGRPARVGIVFQRDTFGERPAARRAPVRFGLTGQNGVAMAADSFHETSVPEARQGRSYAADLIWWAIALAHSRMASQSRISDPAILFIGFSGSFRSRLKGNGNNSESHRPPKIFTSAGLIQLQRANCLAACSRAAAKSADSVRVGPRTKHQGRRASNHERCRAANLWKSLGKAAYVQRSAQNQGCCPLQRFDTTDRYQLCPQAKLP